MGLKNGFWKNKKVLLTGHTGFKGSWLSLWLAHLGADVVGLSLKPNTDPNLFEAAQVAKDIVSLNCDIRNYKQLYECIEHHKPEIVFHLAAQALVKYSYENPIETYETNVLGTLNLLEATRKVGGVRSIVVVTTDKCYENMEWEWGYRETDPLGGHDLYSSSKACAEILVNSYRQSFFKSAEAELNGGTYVATARAGNVIGGGDWAKDRLLPDIVRAVENKQAIKVRNPHSIRPWQHVLEPLAGYLELNERLYTEDAKFAEAWNFGPHTSENQTVQWVISQVHKSWGLPLDWADDKNKGPHEAKSLKLDCSKALSRLSWRPRWSLEKSIDEVVSWHKGFKNGDSARELCLKQIKTYSMELGI